MYAILQGSFQDGFQVIEVEHTADLAEETVVRGLADGRMTGSVELEDPATYAGDFERDPTGKHIVIFSGGILGAVSCAVGPFSFAATAVEFGEAHREMGAWEVLSYV